MLPTSLLTARVVHWVRLFVWIRPGIRVVLICLRWVLYLCDWTLFVWITLILCESLLICVTRFLIVRHCSYLCWEECLFLCDLWFCICATQFSICAIHFKFVWFILYLCDSFSICATRFSICATQFFICAIHLKFVWSILYLRDSFCICATQLFICAIRFVFVRGSCGPPYNPLTLQPEQSGGVGSSPGRAPPLERHD